MRGRKTRFYPQQSFALPLLSASAGRRTLSARRGALSASFSFVTPFSACLEMRHPREKNIAFVVGAIHLAGVKWPSSAVLEISPHYRLPAELASSRLRRFRVLIKSTFYPGRAETAEYLFQKTAHLILPPVSCPSSEALFRMPFIKPGDFSVE